MSSMNSPMKIRLCFSTSLNTLCAISLLFALLALPKAAAQTITVNPNIQHQTMGYRVNSIWTGAWEATTFLGDHNKPAYANYFDPLLDMSIDELGIDRVRLEVRSGVENSTDYWQNWINLGSPTGSNASYCDWRESRYATVDDGRNPNDPSSIPDSKSLNMNGFNFSELDHKINTVILPLRSKLSARGKHLYINLNYVSFNGQIFNFSTACLPRTATKDYHHTRDPEEYAEFVLATYLHMDQTFGFVPDSWEVILEPDNSSGGYTGNLWPRWSASNIHLLAEAAADRLAAHGYNPKLVLPSNKNCQSAANWAPTILQHFNSRGKLGYLREIAYHLYGGNTIAARQQLFSAAALYGINTSQLEWLAMRTIDDFHNDLVHGNVSAWSHYTYREYFSVNESDPANPVITFTKNGRFLRQYQKFIHPGAVRVDAAITGSATLMPVAFINTDGKIVVVVSSSTNAVQNFTITGLPPGTYGFNYSTPSDFDKSLPDAVITSGQGISASLPRDGAITIFQKSAAGSSPGTFRLSVPSAAYSENAGSIPVSVQRTNGASGAVSVSYSTANGTAAAGEDFQAVSGTLTWSDGDAHTAVFDIPIINDKISGEGIEQFSVALSSPTGGAAVGAPGSLNLSIDDDDVSTSSGIIGQWRLDDGAGSTTAADSSAYANAGTLVGGPSWISGVLGQALDFDGIDDTVRIGSPAILTDLSAHTISLWVKPAAGGSYIIAKRGTSGGAWRLAVSPALSLVWFRVTSGTNVMSSTVDNALSLNSWHHVAVTWDGTLAAGSARVYIDGKRISLCLTDSRHRKHFIRCRISAYYC